MANNTEVKVYFKVNENLQSLLVAGFTDQPADDMKRVGLSNLRTITGADNDSQIMAIVK